MPAGLDLLLGPVRVTDSHVLIRRDAGAAEDERQDDQFLDRERAGARLDRGDGGFGPTEAQPASFCGYGLLRHPAFCAKKPEALTDNPSKRDDVNHGEQYGIAPHECQGSNTSTLT